MTARITREVVLWLAILVVAALLRFAALGWPPLNDREADLALAAAQGTPSASAFWEGGSEGIAASPAYYTLTRLLFGFFGATDAGARFFPALAGTLVVLLPLALRDRLGRMPAILAGLTLALSPTMVAASRTAGGAAFALLGLGGWLALTSPSPPEASWRARRIAGGVLAGLGLAAGPTALTGALILAVGWGLSRLVDRERTASPGGGEAGWVGRQAVIAAAVALALASTLGARVEGLAGIFDSLGVWISGWGTAEGLPPLAWLLTLPLHDILLFAFGVWGAIAGLRRRDRGAPFLVAWAMAGVMVLLVYPSRQAVDLAWICLPLAILAGLALRDILEGARAAWSWAGHALLVSALLLLALFVLYQLSAYALGRGPGLNPAEPRLSLVLVLIAGGLAVVMVILFALGWSREVAWTSAGIAGFVVVGFMSLSTNWRLSLGASAAGAGSLWRSQANTAGLTMLVETLEGISQARTGFTDALPIGVESPLPAGVAWALRQFPRAGTGSPDAPAEVVLAPEDSVPTDLPAEYLGQVIKTGERWGWIGPLPPLQIVSTGDWEALTLAERWVLLVRADVATFGTLTEGLPGTP